MSRVYLLADFGKGPRVCWPWPGKIHRSGYGRTHYQGKCMNAHRAVWWRAFGDPGSLQVLHRCDNRACVNPAHLFLGTTEENTADRHAKGRDARGERNRHAKLSEPQVREIRRRHAGGESRAALARAFGVEWTAISRAVSGRSWKHLDSGGSR